MSWLTLTVTAVITFGAAARITRLVVEDSLTAPLRDALAERAHTAGERGRKHPASKYLAKLVTCTWCTGFWISAAVLLAPFHLHTPGWWHDGLTGWFHYTAAALTLSWAVATAADWLDSPPAERLHSLRPVQVTLKNAK